PASGSIAGGEQEAIGVTFCAEDLDPGVYYAALNIGLDIEDQPSIEIPLIMSVESAVGAIGGVVTDAADDEPISGAHVVLEPSGLMRTTDNQGRFEMTDLPVGTYNLSCNITDHLPYLSEDIEVVEDETADGSMAILHAEFNPDQQEIVEEVPSGEQRRVEFNVSNDGNGDLEFSAERRLLGPADADPWDLRQTFNVGDSLQDSRLEGVVFDGDNFFVSGGNRWGREDSTNMIYVLDREGEFVRRFEQAGGAASGMRDLAWDGELIWGSGERNVFGFDREGNLEVTFAGHYVSNQALAWDPDREMLWMAGITTNIAGYTRDGEYQAELDRNGFRIYGLAYWPDDPDGYPLYVYHSPGGDDQVVHKIDPDSNDTLLVVALPADPEGRPAGTCIVNSFDIYSWVMVTLVNNGVADRIDIWQLEARLDWMLLDPLEGVIAAGESGGFTLDLDAEGMPEAAFEGELVFTHNGVGGETVIPITMNVTGVNEPQPPSDFNLLEPADGDTLYAGEVLSFIWEQSVDPDEEDVVGYRLWFGAADDSVETALADTTLDVLPDTLFAEMDRPLEVTWWVQAVSGEDTVECLQRFGCRFFPSHDVGDGEAGLPEEFAIQTICPNPFNAR
ncbi:MAG TPA: carboxypeptidase regulatory-like domain-containing protein, partial [Bacteroidetes bacterium]|nr:carboxypeptidase regulatory-like domain-containing protein [Bacteroidota bacterium]